MAKIFNQISLCLSVGLVLVVIQISTTTEVQAIPTLKGNLEWRTCPIDKPIKGNVNRRKATKIYHVPTGAFYKRTNPEQCFESTLEAEAAGFRASKR